MTLTADQLDRISANWFSIISLIYPGIPVIGQGDASSLASLLSTWPKFIPHQPPGESVILDALGLVEEVNAQYQAVKIAIKFQASAAVGMTLLELRNNDNSKDALLAILLAMAGAVAYDGTIKPLFEWVEL